MNWTNFSSLKQVSLFKGSVFCFPAEHPFESTVHFMLIEEPESDSGFKFICSTGYHAGQTEVLLPNEAKSTDGGINRKWLQENWNKWVYPNVSIDDVEYIENYIAG
jgi:hypothetical protein